VALASAGPYADYLRFVSDRQPCQHLITQIFTGWMLFLTLSQQYQSTDDKLATTTEIKTSGQSNLTKDRIAAAADGSIVFARWRQCALLCGHIGATWRIRLNLCFLWPT